MIQKRVPRKSPKTVPFSVRMPEDLHDRLRSCALRDRNENLSAYVLELLEEEIRMREFPGIDFRWGGSGRHPYVTWTGLTVWEAYHLWDDHDRNVEKLRKNYPNLTKEKVEVGVAYAKKYLHEEPPGFWGAEPPPGAKVVRIKI